MIDIIWVRVLILMVILEKWILLVIPEFVQVIQNGYILDKLCDLIYYNFILNDT